jgi:hypothetical protein
MQPLLLVLLLSSSGSLLLAPAIPLEHRNVAAPSPPRRQFLQIDSADHQPNGPSPSGSPLQSRPPGSERPVGGTAPSQSPPQGSPRPGETVPGRPRPGDAPPVSGAMPGSSGVPPRGTPPSGRQSQVGGEATEGSGGAQGGFNWTLAAVGGGVLAVAGIVAVVIVVRKRSARKTETRSGNPYAATGSASAPPMEFVGGGMKTVF